MENKEKYIGYIKYEGERVKDGLMDARKQGKALLAFDEALRYYIAKQYPDLKSLDYEIPVRVRKGSWEALIPETIGGWVLAAISIAGTTYVTTAAKKMAEKDFEDFGVTDAFRKAIDAIKWFARIGKHMGDITIRAFSNVKFNDDRTLVGIRNENGDFLYVPAQILDLYINSNPKLLEGLAENIGEERRLAIGTIINNVTDEEVIDVNDKSIFCDSEDEISEDILFPELIHGDEVVLEGEVTRENKTSNSMGFKYIDHILTAYPDKGSIVKYKPLLFLRCRLYGTVDRTDDKGRVGAKRPKLYFRHLEPLESDRSRDLFDYE